MVSWTMLIMSHLVTRTVVSHYQSQTKTLLAISQDDNMIWFSMACYTRRLSAHHAKYKFYCLSGKVNLTDMKGAASYKNIQH